MTYNDPLHIPYQDLVVNYNGKEVLMLNKALLDQQNAWDNLEEIKETHWLKLVICEMVQETEDASELKSLAQDLTEIEFYLQELWGFPKDIKFHRFWEYPKCECPKFDNLDAYPYASYISSNCRLHW